MAFTSGPLPMASSQRRRKHAAFFGLWTRLTMVAVVGSYALTWLFLGVLEFFQR